MKKAVLITGCDSGFGFSLASHLSETRPDILTLACCYFPDGKSEGADILLQGYNNVHVLKVDVASEKSVNRLVEEVDTILAYSKTQLWAVVNNAATLVFADAIWQTSRQVRHQFDVNVIGCWLVSRAFAPHLMLSKGRMVNMVSFCTECPLPALSVYTATKASLMALSDGMRMELAKHGVDVVLFNPGDYPAQTPLCYGQHNHYEAMRSDIAKRFSSHADVMTSFGKYEAKFTGLFGQSPPAIRKLDSPRLYKRFDEILEAKRPKRAYVNSDLMTRTFFALLSTMPTRWSDWARTAIMRLPK